MTMIINVQKFYEDSGQDEIDLAALSEGDEEEVPATTENGLLDIRIQELEALIRQREQEEYEMEHTEREEGK